jgi:hypothetical protein
MISHLKEEISNVNVSIPECPCLHPGFKLATFMKQWRQTLAVPADAPAFLLEIAKFLGTLALILATALIMLMAG